mmetsp:Transcript_41512/g.120187  ORF Transcript_41512/g.120187 Transcript_41512/m.120187 type:complete len:353 (-) Transcript_41512:72-1130(-)
MGFPLGREVADTAGTQPVLPEIRQVAQRVQGHLAPWAIKPQFEQGRLDQRRELLFVSQPQAKAGVCATGLPSVGGHPDDAAVQCNLDLRPTDPADLVGKGFQDIHQITDGQLQHRQERHRAPGLPDAEGVVAHQHVIAPILARGEPFPSQGADASPDDAKGALGEDLLARGVEGGNEPFGESEQGVGGHRRDEPDALDPRAVHEVREFPPQLRGHLPDDLRLGPLPRDLPALDEVTPEGLPHGVGHGVFVEERVQFVHRLPMSIFMRIHGADDAADGAYHIRPHRRRDRGAQRRHGVLRRRDGRHVAVAHAGQRDNRPIEGKHVHPPRALVSFGRRRRLRAAKRHEPRGARA